jgi:hypothetical protein
MEKSGQRDKVPTKQKSAQAMEATVSPPQFHPRSVTMRNQESRDVPTPRRQTLSEHQNREYSFPAEEVEDLFMGLQELNLIELPKPKRSEEASKFKEPNFCHYHHILGHTLKGCFIVKKIIQKMIDDGTIDANLLKSFKKGEKMATSNVATFDNPMDIFLNSNLSEKMKARLSFGGSPLQEEECQLPEDQESINSNSQDDVPSNK